MDPKLLRNVDIRTRLLLLCLLVSTPLVVMCGLVICKEYQGLSQTAHKSTIIHDRIAIRAVSQWISAQRNELKTLSLAAEIPSTDYEQTKQLLVNQAKHEPSWHALVLVEENTAKVLCASADLKPMNSTATSNLMKVLRKGDPVSSYVRCPFTNKPAILIWQRVPTSARGSKKVLVASVNPKAVLQLFRGLDATEGSVICVVDKDKRVVARSLDHEKFMGKDWSGAKTVTADSKGIRGTIEVVGIADHTHRTYAFDRVPESGWLVIVGIPTAMMYGSAMERLLIMIGCTGLAVVSSMLLAYAFTRLFTEPIHDLVREALAIGRGELSRRVNLKQGGELGLLARAFNQMAVNLEINREHKAMVEKISESVRQSLDLDHILNTAVLELGQALTASRCCLALVDTDSTKADALTGKALEFNYVWWDPGRGGSALKNRSVVITERSILKIILEQRAILSLDVMDALAFTPMFEKSEESPEDWRSIKSLIACPIILNKHPVGMILVQQCDDRRQWIDLELELVEAVATHVSLAMEHARLFSRTKTLAEQETLINHIVRATRSSLDTDTILNTVTAELGKALKVDYCQIAEPRPEGPLVITQEFRAPGLAPKKGLCLYNNRLDFHPDDDSSGERSVLGIDLKALQQEGETGETTLQEAPIAVIFDVSEDKRATNFREFLESVGSKSLIAAPLLRDDRVLGLLIVHQCERVRNWQAGEVRLLAAVADQLAVAISHAQLFEQVKHQAITDGLTGLYNHIYFKNRLAEELNRAQRKNTTCSLLMLDLDRLKQINDTMGHPVGDAAIRQVATALKSLIRSGDTAARYGGEEFAVILPETPMSEAILIANRLRRNINRNPVPGLGHISASIGAAVFPSQANSLEDLVDKADRALYFAKRSGRNRVCIWDDPAPKQVDLEEFPSEDPPPSVEEAVSQV